MFSTNRAMGAQAICLTVLLLSSAAPGQGEAGQKTPQDVAIERIVAEVRAAEAALNSVQMELSTVAVYPADLTMRTSGTLSVLRGEQPRLRATVEMRYSNGLVGLMDSAQTAGGVVLYKSDPALGDVYVQVPPAIVEDLRWAGTVLDRADLPGMRDARAEAPLGSAMLDGLRREFELQVGKRTTRGDDEGVWLEGARRPGLGDLPDGLPLADRVEAFVRTRDHAVLEVRELRGEDVILGIEVKSLVVDGEIAPKVFEVDGRGETLRDVEDYLPLWTQIQDVIRRAEAKLTPDEQPENVPPPQEAVRPSRRVK